MQNYSIKYNECPRKDYISRTLIIIIEKYRLNEKPMFITYDMFQKELKYTISFMTGYVDLNTVNEIINSIIFLEEDNNLINEKKLDNKNISHENVSINSECEDEECGDEFIENIIKEKKKYCLILMMWSLI